MTREEAIKFLSNTKVYVNGKSKEIQEKLFSLGFQWKFDGKKVRHEEKPFLFFGEDMELYYSSDMEHFTKKASREITANDILNIVIDEPKYRPFRDANECFKEMQKHQPFGWVYADLLNEFNGALMQITLINNKGYRFVTDRRDRSYSDAFEINSVYFADGTPFGIKEEE